MKKKSNGVLIVIIIMIILSLSGGIIGLLASIREDTITPSDKNNEKKDYEITYRYYIDSEEVSKSKIDDSKEKTVECDLVTNPTCTSTKQEATIKFEKYTCTNNVKGEWNETNWEFTPDLTANTTCRIYFTNLIHDIKIAVTNATLPVDNPEGIIKNKLGQDSTIVITPTTGYKFDKADCDNNATAEFNQETNLLTIKNVTKNTSCTISFKINDYTVEVKTSNGTSSSEPKSANYGGTVTFDVTPAENYGEATVTCTNEQKGTFANNILTVSGITNNTVCTVQFKKIQYSVNLTVVNGSLLSQSVNPQHPDANGLVTFAISPNEGFGYTGAEATCDNENYIPTIFATSNVVRITGVNANLNCKLVLKKIETETNN